MLLQSSNFNSFIISRSTSRHSPFGLRCSIIGFAGLKNGRVVVIVYFCIGASVRSAMRLMGSGESLYVDEAVVLLG